MNRTTRLPSGQRAWPVHGRWVLTAPKSASHLDSIFPKREGYLEYHYRNYRVPGPIELLPQLTWIPSNTLWWRRWWRGLLGLNPDKDMAEQLRAWDSLWNLPLACSVCDSRGAAVHAVIGAPEIVAGSAAPPRHPSVWEFDCPLCGEETRIDVRGLDPDALLHRWSELSEGNSTERAGWEDVQVLEPILVDFPSWLARFDLSTVGDAAAVAVVAQWMYPTVQQLLGVCTAAPRTGGKRWLGSACNLVERPKDLRRVRKRDRRDTISVSLRNGTSYEVQLQDSSPDGELVSAVVPGTAGFALRQNWIGVLARIPIALLREAWIPDDPICVRVTVGSEEVWRAACGKYRGETTWMSLNRTATRGAGCSEHPGWEGSDRIAGGMELVAYPAFVGMVRHDDAAESEFPYVALLDPEWVRAVRDATGVPLPETLAGRRKRSPQLGLHVEDASGLTRSLYIEDGRRGQPAKAVLRTVKRPRGQRGR